MASAYERAWTFLSAKPPVEDFDFGAIVLVWRLLDGPPMPANLKVDLRAELDTWFEESLQLDEDGDTSLSVDGFDETYHRWIAQDPVVPPTEVSATA